MKDVQEPERLPKLRIVATTNHPAPYMDLLFRAIASEFDLTVIYNHEQSPDKPWRDGCPHFPGELASIINKSRLAEIVQAADFVLVWGWGSKFNRSLIGNALIAKRKLAIFSDAPDLKNKKMLMRLLQSAVLRLLPCFFVSGDQAARIFCRTYWLSRSKIQTFPYAPMATDKASVAAINLDRRVALTCQDQKLRLLIANRFLERKGYDTVLIALKLLKSLGMLDKFDIQIAGSGEEFDRYHAAFLSVSTDIKMLGWVESDEYRDLIKWTDIFVHASDFEPYGIPVVDAVLNGKLVIASEGVCSAIDMHELGAKTWLFKSGDSEELARLLSEALKRRNFLYADLTPQIDESRLAPRLNLAAIRSAISSF